MRINGPMGPDRSAASARAHEKANAHKACVKQQRNRKCELPGLEESCKKRSVHDRTVIFVKLEPVRQAQAANKAQNGSEFKLAEGRVRYFKYCQGVVRPKSMAGTPSTPSKRLLLVVLTNLRSSGGARLHHRFFAQPAHFAAEQPRTHDDTGSAHFRKDKCARQFLRRRRLTAQPRVALAHPGD